MDPVVTGGPAWPGSSYTATDDGLGYTADSLRTRQEQRGRFGTFVRAEVSGVADAAGPPYPDRNGRAAHPTLVLVDELGRSLALNGTPAGSDCEGRAAPHRSWPARGCCHPTVRWRWSALGPS